VSQEGTVKPRLLKPHSVIKMALLALTMYAVLLSSSCQEGSQDSLSVQLLNRTSAPLQGLAIVSNDVTQVLPSVPPDGETAVSFRTGDRGENALLLSDTTSGREYVIHPYFEGVLVGEITLEIVAQDPMLTGEVVIDTWWYRNERMPLAVTEGSGD